MTLLFSRLPIPLRCRGALTLALALALVLAPGREANAQSGTKEMVEAQALFDQGIHLFNLGRFEEACPKFEASLALVAGIGTRGKLAECYEKLGRTASAWRLYREVERLARDSGDTVRAQVAAERARELEPRLARLTIEPGPSVTVVGFEVSKNSMEVDPRTYGSAQEVDPGMYVIVATAPARQKWATTVHVGEGKREVVDIPALAMATGNGAAGGARVVAYGLVGAGIASTLGGGLYFGSRAQSLWDDAERNGCKREQGGVICPSRGEQPARDANRFANYANISVVAGVAALSGGIYLLWKHSGPGATPVQVTPAVSTSSAGFVVQASF